MWWKMREYPAYLEPEGCQLEDKLECKDCCEYHVKVIQHVSVHVWLPVELHGQRHRIYHDQDEDRVLEWLRRHEPPHFVLNPVLGYVPAHRLRLERKLYAVTLVLVQVAVLVLLLALVLERNNNETYEDVHHEERDYNNVDDVVGGHDRPEVVDGAAILLVRVDADVEEGGPSLECGHGE